MTTKPRTGHRDLVPGIDARAELIAPALRHDSDVAAALEALEAKYPQYADVPVLREPPTMIAFTLDRITSWSG
jgi:hypothetical protein